MRKRRVGTVTSPIMLEPSHQSHYTCYDQSHLPFFSIIPWATQNRLQPVGSREDSSTSSQIPLPREQTHSSHLPWIRRLFLAATMIFPAASNSIFTRALSLYLRRPSPRQYACVKHIKKLGDSGQRNHGYSCSSQECCQNRVLDPMKDCLGAVK